MTKNDYFEETSQLLLPFFTSMEPREFLRRAFEAGWEAHLDQLSQYIMSPEEEAEWESSISSGVSPSDQ